MLGSLLNPLRKLLTGLCLTMLALLIATPLAQIVMRGVFNVPMSAAEELTRYFMICMVFLGAPLVTHWGGQIAMEEVQVLIPARPRWWLQLVVDLSGIAFFTLLAVAALYTIRNNMNNRTATLEMPFWLFMAPLALSAALMVLETAVKFVHTWQRKRPTEKHTVLT